MRILILALCIITTSCGAGVQTVCGINYSDNGAGTLVDIQDVAPLPFASYHMVSESMAMLDSGGFSAAADMSCQFGVRAGHIYR
jgi:hypothetical protein